MKRYKLRSFIVVALVVAVSVLFVLTYSSFAISKLEDAADPEQSALSFVKDYTKVTFLYENIDIKAQTSAVLNQEDRDTICVDKNIFSEFTDTARHLKEELIHDSMDYALDKAEYLKYVRMLQELYRRDFRVEYSVKEVEVEGKYAHVSLSENICFCYLGRNVESFLEQSYDVYLYQFNNAWLVFSVLTDDGMDSQYLLGDDTFDVSKEKASFEAAFRNSNAVSPTISESNTNADDAIFDNMEYSQKVASSYNIGVYRSYNRNNAINYAYTYSKMNTNDFPSYYNPNFYRIRTIYGWPNNADCMNFVSQCFYAGFYGSNDTASINSASFPQDYGGVNDSKFWYAKPSSPNWAWTENNYFHTYVQNASSSSGTRMLAVIQPYAGTEMNITYPSNVKGALFQVPGSGGAYSHAIIITEQYGNGRNQLYYTSHTGDAKSVNFGDTWPNASFRVILPTSMVQVVTCTSSAHAYSSIPSGRGTDSTCNNCGFCRLYVRNTLQNAVQHGSTITLNGNTSYPCYRMAMSVTAPNGTTTWLGEVLNSSSYAKTYTFSQTGLYTVTLHARDLDPNYYPSTSKAVYNTYTIRVY